MIQKKDAINIATPATPAQPARKPMIQTVLVQRKLDKSTFLLRDFSRLRQEGFSGITKR